jgi:D-glycero-alpha-D-manno-heptose-7-phosphate kinase
MMELHVSAPNRIDLAGGTTDIYPLYLFMNGGCTVNVGITVSSSVRLGTREDRGIRIISRDLGATVEAPEPDLLPTHGPLGLIARTVRAFTWETGLEIVTHNEAPAGSGLGASSALLIALVGGLLKLRSEEIGPEKTIDLAAHIETAAIEVPTGKQDHIAAYFGGISAIEFDYRGFCRTERCGTPGERARLQDMMILSHTGEGRFSGMNNWEVTKGFIDKQTEAREKLLAIRDVARELSRALEQNQWDEIPRLMNQEWKVRRSLAPGISTSRIDKIIAAATAAGALANKVCGAGGGGCMVTLTPVHKRAAVERAISDTGGRILAYEIDIRGLGLREDSGVTP